MNANILFSIGNLLFLIASYPMIQDVIRTKKNLKGYSLIGSICTFTGLIFMLLGFSTIQSFVSMVLMIPTIVYWHFVCKYLLQVQKHKRWNLCLK